MWRPPPAGSASACGGAGAGRSACRRCGPRTASGSRGGCRRSPAARRDVAGGPQRSPDTSLTEPLAALLELWRLNDLAAKVRHRTVFTVEAKQLPLSFDVLDSFGIPGMAFVTAPATEESVRAWNLPCLAREESGKFGPRFVVLSALAGERAVVVGPGGVRDELPLADWVKRLGGTLVILAPEQAIPAALQPGDRGPAVLELQRELRRAAFLRTAPDGVYGKRTASAVRALQGSLGLEQTGVAGRATRLRLLRLDGRAVPLLQGPP